MASPLQEFQDKNRERWKVMHDVPPWVVGSVIGFLEDVFFEIDNDDVIRTIQCRMRMMLSDYCSVDYGNVHNFSRDLEEDSINGSEDIILPLLDIAIKYIRAYAPNPMQLGGRYGTKIWHRDRTLDYIDYLLNNGSKWKVLRTKNSESGLIERINPEITEIAQKIDNNFLTKAWNQAFQRQPDPERAVISAQKAIESIASECGFTKATSGVYGNILGDIKTNPHRYFSKAREAYDLQNVITKQSKDKLNVNEQFANWFWSGMDLIQKTNPARHASKEVKEFSLSAEAAQQAVVIATMICWFIESGTFSKENAS